MCLKALDPRLRVGFIGPLAGLEGPLAYGTSSSCKMRIERTYGATSKVPQRYHEEKRRKSCTPAVRSTSRDVQLVLHVEAFRMRHHMPRSDEYWPSYGYSKMVLKRQFEFFFSAVHVSTIALHLQTFWWPCDDHISPHTWPNTTNK